MGLERVPSLPFLLRQVRVGVVATGLTVAALGVSYFGLERAPFHRVGLAIVLVIAATGGACIAVLPWARLFDTTGMRFLYVWSVADIVLISFAVAATGGGRSDLFLLYTLTTFFFVASYPPIAQLALAFVQAKRLPFPLLVDPEREAYRAYGLMQGKVMQVLSPRSALPWIRAELSPETRQRGLKGGSFMQMPGTFVIDTGGVVRFTGGLIQFAHRNKHVADSPTNDLILRVLASLVGRAPDDIALAGEGGPDPQPDPA